MKPFRRLPERSRNVSGDHRPVLPDTLHFESAPPPDIAREGVGFESLNPFPLLDRGDVVRSSAGSYARRPVDSSRSRSVATFIDVGEGQERSLAVDHPATLTMTANETRLAGTEKETNPIVYGQAADVSLVHPTQLQVIRQANAYLVAQGLVQRRAYDATVEEEPDE
ncbi:MAG: hypothetical protein E6Q97_18380 [Desulfurellales bacterium]|nr:MAG: hypothetical protein E6Q97_18380 [Desulfurellales bacterium]